MRTTEARALLGLPPKGRISAADIKKAYRKAAVQWHPDKSKHPAAKDVFQLLQEKKGWFLAE